MVAPAKRPDLRASEPRKQPEQKELRMRVTWLLQWMRRNPSKRYADQMEAVRDRFGCSISTAQRTIALAEERIDQQLAKIDLSWVVDQYMVQLQEARAAGKHNAARAILDSIARVTGNEKPTKIAIEHTGQVDVRAMAHVAILQLTPNQRANRERELLAKAGAPELIDVAPSSNGANGHHVAQDLDDDTDAG